MAASPREIEREREKGAAAVIFNSNRGESLSNKFWKIKGPSLAYIHEFNHLR